MRKAIIIFLSAMVSFTGANAQVKIGDNPQNISQGSLLELESTSKALTLPRMTTVQMQAIPSPVNGMIIFNIDSNCIYLYKTNNVWASISMDAHPSREWPYLSNDSTIGVAGNKAGIISLTGSGLVASGDYSHAEGNNSVATGNYSWSSGFSDTATGAASTAMGSQNKTAGLYSFALGFKNTAAYQSSFALGQENTDSGWASLAFGIKNNILSTVSYSNALGLQNEIRAGSSHMAMGESNIIKAGRANGSMGYANVIETGNFINVFGTNNNVTSGNSHFASGENNAIKSGNANSLLGRSNIADGNYLGAIGKDNIVFYQSGVALGQANKDSGWSSIAGGLSNTIRAGVQYSSTFGTTNNLNGGSSNIASGESNNINNGNSNALFGYNNTSQNNYNILAGSTNTATTGSANSIFGQNNFADGSYLGAMGKDNIVYYQSGIALGQANKDSGYASITGGLSNIINAGVQYSSSFGYNNKLSAGASNSVMGENSTIKSGRANSIFGQNNIADGNYLAAMGKDNIVFYQSAIALGQGNLDSGYTTIAGGLNNIVNTGVQYSASFGYNNQLSGGASNMIMGESNIIKTGRANSLFGQNNSADGSNLAALGKDNILFNQSAVALGQGNKDSGYASIAGGLTNLINAGVQYSSSFGYNNQLNGGISHTASGEGNIIKAGRANTAMGYANIISAGNFSNAFGTSNDILAGNSHIVGGENNTIKSGNTNSVFGQNNFADGSYLGAIGKDNIVYYQSAIALGQGNKDSGFASISGGLNNLIKAGVQYSSSFGNANQLNGGTSHTVMGESNVIMAGRANTNMGYANIITAGNFISAFGTSNDVLAGNSHITGGENNTIKSGNANSIFGQSNIADGNYLGAMGRDNTVYYQSAVALGQGNRDSGWASVTGGLGNIVENNVQYSSTFGSNNRMTKNPGLPNTGVGNFSAGINNINSGYASIALGASNRSSSQFGLCANYNTLSNSFGMSAFGHFNDTTSALQGASYQPDEMLFSIGNGLNDVSRRNSLTMMRNGFTTINTTPDLGPNIPRAELDVKGTGAIIVPVGTTAQRPTTPVTGMIRFCTDCPGGPVLQGYDGTNWVNL